MSNSSSLEIKDLALKNGQDHSIAVSKTELDTSLGIMKLKENLLLTFEQNALKQYLEISSGNVSKAAEAAQVPRRTFQRLLAKHHINPTQFKK